MFDKQIKRNDDSFGLDPGLNRNGIIFKGSRPDGLSVVLASVFEDGFKPMILQNRKIEKFQKACKGNSPKEQVDISQLNRLMVMDRKQIFAQLCSLGLVPFCISGSHVSLTQKTFRTNYAVFYDNELCVAAIAEGFGSFANEISHIACRHAVNFVMSRTLDSYINLTDILDSCFAEVENQIEKLEAEHPHLMDTLITGSSLAVLIIFRSKIASGMLGDVVLVKLSQNLDTMSTEFFQINAGLSINTVSERERVFGSMGEIRKNSLGKEAIYVKGREYPECPMISCLGCRVGKKVGVSGDSFFREDMRSELFDRQGCLLLCNREFLKIVEDQENTKLLSCINLSDANAIREYIYGKLKIQYLQKANPIDDCLGLIFVMDKEPTTSNK